MRENKQFESLKYKPRRTDMFFFETLDVNKEVKGVLMREFEGSSYVNFSNVVKVTACSSRDNFAGVTVGDILLVHHNVSDNKLSVSGVEHVMVAYSEDIFAVHRDKGVSPLTIDNFLPVPGFILSQEAYEEYDSAIDVSNKISERYSLDVHTGELIEYRQNADYEVFLDGDRFFVVKEKELINEDNTTVVSDDMMVIDRRIVTDRHGNKRVFNEDFIGYYRK